MNIRCWLFGHSPNWDTWQGGVLPKCKRCGEEVPYSDLVGDTRLNHFKERIKGIVLSFWPAKDNEDDDEVPF